MHKFFTPTPLGGFPPIHLSHPTQAFEGFPPDLLNNWLEEPGFKAIARIFDFPKIAYADASLPRALIEQSIRVIIAHTLPDLPPPTCHPPPKSPKSTNIPTLLVTLPSERAQRSLLRGRIWSSEWITFEALPTTELPPPTAFFAITSFPTDNARYPEKYIRSTWSDPKNARRITDALSRADGPEQTAKDAFNHLIATLSADPFPCQSGLGFSFVIHASTWLNDTELWAKLKTVLLTLDYPPTPLLGHIDITPLPYCSLCHSVAHLRLDCPFPKLHFWNGPS